MAGTGCSTWRAVVSLLPSVHPPRPESHTYSNPPNPRQTDLPWEDMENMQHEENVLSAAPRLDSATRLQNARNLERSSLDPLNSKGSKEFEQLQQQQQQQQKTPPLNGRSGSLPKNSSSDADWAAAFGSVYGGVQPLDSPHSSMSPSSPGPSSFKGALRKHKETNATHGMMSIWESLSGSVVGGPEVCKKERRVKFCNTAQCVLIPSRSDLWAQGISDLLWFPESVRLRPLSSPLLLLLLSSPPPLLLSPTTNPALVLRDNNRFWTRQRERRRRSCKRPWRATRRACPCTQR
jgi:hypothetical protein